MTPIMPLVALLACGLVAIGLLVCWSLCRISTRKMPEPTGRDECPIDCPGPCVIGCDGDAYSNRSQFEGE